MMRSIAGATASTNRRNKYRVRNSAIYVAFPITDLRDENLTSLQCNTQAALCLISFLHAYGTWWGLNMSLNAMYVFNAVKESAQDFVGDSCFWFPFWLGLIMYDDDD